MDFTNYNTHCAHYRFPRHKSDAPQHFIATRAETKRGSRSQRLHDDVSPLTGWPIKKHHRAISKPVAAACALCMMQPYCYIYLIRTTPSRSPEAPSLACRGLQTADSGSGEGFLLPLLDVAHDMPWVHGACPRRNSKRRRTRAALRRIRFLKVPVGLALLKFANDELCKKYALAPMSSSERHLVAPKTGFDERVQAFWSASMQSS